MGVHIADVSYFVLEETALDKVASERATSVYLVQKVRTAFPLSVWWLCLPFTINSFSRFIFRSSQSKSGCYCRTPTKMSKSIKNTEADIAALELMETDRVKQQLMILCLWSGSAPHVPGLTSSLLTWAEFDALKLAPLLCSWGLQIGRCGGFCLAFENSPTNPSQKWICVRGGCKTL